VNGQLRAPAALSRGKDPPPRAHWIGGWVGLRAGLDNVEKRKFLKLPGLELRPLRRPAHSQSLYRHKGFWRKRTFRLLRAAGGTETTQENIQDWLELDEVVFL
jgi:hypothetical protein